MSNYFNNVNQHGYAHNQYMRPPINFTASPYIVTTVSYPTHIAISSFQNNLLTNCPGNRFSISRSIRSGFGNLFCNNRCYDYRTYIYTPNANQNSFRNTLAQKPSIAFEQFKTEMYNSFYSQDENIKSMASNNCELMVNHAVSIVYRPGIKQDSKEYVAARNILNYSYTYKYQDWLYKNTKYMASEYKQADQELSSPDKDVRDLAALKINMIDNTVSGLLTRGFEDKSPDDSAIKTLKFLKGELQREKYGKWLDENIENMAGAYEKADEELSIPDKNVQDFAKLKIEVINNIASKLEQKELKKNSPEYLSLKTLKFLKEEIERKKGLQGVLI